MAFMHLLQAIPLAAILTSGVWALSDMAGCPAGFDWNKDSLGQDPCEIVSILDASCRGLAAFTIPPLNGIQYYLPPGADAFYDVTCDCNTVMYSLYMACALCQGGHIYSWMRWILQCERVHAMQYPVDTTEGNAIPHWAYCDIASLPGQTRDDTIAKDIGRSFQVMPRQIDSTSHPGEPTSTVSTTTSPRTLSTTTSIKSKPQGFTNEGGNPSTNSPVDLTTTVKGPMRTTTSNPLSSVITPVPTATDVSPPTIGAGVLTSTRCTSPAHSDCSGGGNSSVDRLRSIYSVVPFVVLAVLTFL